MLSSQTPTLTLTILASNRAFYTLHDLEGIDWFQTVIAGQYRQGIYADVEYRITMLEADNEQADTDGDDFLLGLFYRLRRRGFAHVIIVKEY